MNKYVYEPLLDLIGYTEGTDRGDKYNETLAYGKYTGGDVSLVTMTLDEVDRLQTKMLKHPKNHWNSSAVGRYQVVRTTLRAVRERLGYSGKELYDEVTQDQIGLYLLWVRGIDKYLAKKISEDTLINNLAKEWASFPTTKDKGYYGGQHSAVKSSKVREVLAEVKKRATQKPVQSDPEDLQGKVPEEPKKSSAGLYALLTAFLAGLVTLGLLNADDLAEILEMLEGTIK